ncbi:nucleoside deaminase [Candidatus Sumerlaeota bacterium]|nr:nucleoside deaminase [Candidatus Sumerlaeota bacterium]HMZ51740.1 tRNA adenosine(34) deaminase TadA [Candidatus Sumerlaeota bacterium]
MHDDAWWMRRALGWAQLAAERGDVPIGAVLAKDDELLAMAHDARELLADPTGHAELICLREGARKIGDWRLDGCTLYVTLEPCPMCAGGLVQARVKRLVYGASNARWGACREGVDPNILANPRFNHRVEITAGVLEDECARLLKETFRAYRRKET